MNEIKLAMFTVESLQTQPFGTWDDNGGLPDGDMYLLPLDEVNSFEGMKIEDGFSVKYTGTKNKYKNWCGFSSRKIAYTLDFDTAKEIYNEADG